MLRDIWTSCVVAILAGLIQTPLSAQEAAPQEFEFNVLLSDWSVLGPFPKLDNSSGGTQMVIAADDAALAPEKPLEYEGQVYEWQQWDHRVVDFDRALGAVGDDAKNTVGYAWTSFRSETEGPATLAVGHDDSVAVWFNGEEVHRDADAATPCYLDHARIPVQLKEGVNTLLLKVGQGTGDWQAMARILPVNAESPLVTLATNRSAAGDMSRLPVLDVELLGADGQVMQTLKASGFRNESPPGLRFTAYADRPEGEVVQVRVSYSAAPLEDFSEVFGWEEVHAGGVNIPLAADRPFITLVSDASTGAAVSGVQFWTGEKRLKARSDESGRFSIPQLNPLADKMWVAAPGYAATEQDIPWPWPAEHSIQLQPGGKTLKGLVKSKTGEPISGATIRPGLYSGYQPIATTDATGHFEIVSVPADKTRLFPVVVKEGFVPKDRFSEDLTGAVTEVTWELEPGAVATGKVTSAATGEPIQGVTITAGHDRFASNSENSSTTTNANGEYHLTGIPPGQMVLNAFSDDFAPAMQSYTATTTAVAQIDFELDAGQPVTGRITHPDGTPVADVWLVTDTWKGVRMFRREAHTDADGRFTLAHMPEPHTEVHVLKRDYVSRRDLRAVPGETYEITLSPVVEHRVRVRLADNDDPIAELVVQRGYLWSGRDQINWEGRSSYDRNYDKSTGVFTIRNSESRNDAKLFWRFRYPGYQDAEIQEPGSADGSQQIDVVLKRAESLDGRVVSAETGQPLAGIAVALVSKQDRLRVDHYVQFRHPWTGLQEDFTGTSSITDMNGAFTLPKPSDPASVGVVLTAENGGFQFFPNLDSWIADPRGSEPGELLYPYAAAGRIEGRITIAGEPAAGEIVHAGWQPPVKAGESAWDLPFGVGGQVTCDADGKFSFPALGAGRWRISRVRAFNRPGGGGLSMYMEGDEVTLLPGQTLVHNVEQPPGYSFSGKTVDPQGNPLGGCVVEVSVAGDRARRIDAVRADADGYFTVKHVPEPKLNLQATHYSSVDGSMCGLGGEDFRGSQTITLPEDSNVELTLNAVRGNSLTNAAQLTGSIPPDFTASPLDSDVEFTLSENWGKVVAIDFWATWCGPCMAVMPEMKSLYETYKDRDDVVFITVSLDQDEQQLRKVMQEQGIHFPVVFSNKGWDDPVARSFGVTGVPSSFVIGRDGRFAAEKVHGSNLAAAVETALQQPVDELYTSGAKPGRLTIQLNLEGTELGIPGAQLKLSAVDKSGSVVRQDDLNVPGLASKLTWLYPLVPDGHLTAEVTAEGFEAQTTQVPSPDAAETVTFEFTPPRLLTGIVATADGTRAQGIKVTARGASGYQPSATSDEQGQFTIPVLPGPYTITLTGTDDFAPVATSRVSATVATDADPEPLELEVCTTIELTGTVIGTDGLPAADAKVRWSGSTEPVSTGEGGRFQLPGFPSKGSHQVFAFVDKVYGAIQTGDADPAEPVKITLGEGLGNSDSSPKLRKGQHVPPLSAMTLAGSPVSWDAASDRDRLLVFCELARPDSREFVRNATTWADEHQVGLEIFSTDWGLGMAKLALEEFDVAAPVAWVGPSTLGLHADWGMAAPTQAVLISKNGKVQDVPESGNLPGQ